MKFIKTLYKLFLVLSVVAFVSSCEDHLTELNVNPKGVDPETVQPNLMVPTVISQTVAPYLKDNYEGDLAGVMQYVQKSGWGSGLNSFDWVGEKCWCGRYGNLRDANHLYKRAEEEGMEFQMGLALVMRAFNFGFITDSWGDAPYTAALNGANGEQEDLFPAFDSQETIYKGIIEDLKAANTLLSKSAGAYVGISASADLIYGGDPAKWRKLANSLLLRYYMRVSTKLPALAKAGIEEIVSNSGTYPIFTSNDDDALMEFVGSVGDDSWPAAIEFDSSEGNFNRIQLCAGFRDVLVDLNDPRIAVWFNKVEVPIKVSSMYGEGSNTVDGVRYLHPDYIAENDYAIYNQDTWVADAEAGMLVIDTMDYNGIPIAIYATGGEFWNLNPNPIQGGPNVHNSQLADMFKESKGDLLKAKVTTYAEVCFILAEAAQKGWSVGDQQAWYEKGVEASFDAWETDGAADYIAGAGVAYDGSLEQIMVQKWISNYTVAHESWCDWRRTGLPNFTIGLKGKREAMPLRFVYDEDEKDRNGENYNAAISNLVETADTKQDGKDSSWSKFWLLQ